MNYKELSAVEGIKLLAEKKAALKAEVSKKVIGQEEVIDKVLTAIFSNGHVLLVGVPGLAKTLLVNTISQVLGLGFNRIQFTPDLMPADIVGSEILGEDRSFKFLKGPVFTNVLLADEINRTPPKTQAALLESMQEKKVTNAGKSYELPQPFFVLATQNPIEQEGTYPLPEAQLDRFMFNVWVDYPSKAEEIALVKQTTSSNESEVNSVIDAATIVYFQDLIKQLPVPDTVYDYAVNLVVSTRVNGENPSSISQQFLSWGAGPRASQYLITAAKTHAALSGKYAVDIEDVKAIALPVLRHRLVKNYQADAEGLTIDQIIKELL